MVPRAMAAARANAHTSARRSSAPPHSRPRTGPGRAGLGTCTLGVRSRPPPPAPASALERGREGETHRVGHARAPAEVQRRDATRGRQSARRGVSHAPVPTEHNLAVPPGGCQPDTNTQARTRAHRTTHTTRIHNTQTRARSHEATSTPHAAEPSPPPPTPPAHRAAWAAPGSASCRATPSSPTSIPRRSMHVTALDMNWSLHACDVEGGGGRPGEGGGRRPRGGRPCTRTCTPPASTPDSV